MLHQHKTIFVALKIPPSSINPQWFSVAQSNGCTFVCTWDYSTLLSARLVMLALVARWATKAASRAAAALCDWTHVERTCCHQGEIDWGSHESSIAPDKRRARGRGNSCNFRFYWSIKCNKNLYLRYPPLSIYNTHVHKLYRTHTFHVAEDDKQCVKVSSSFLWFL